MPTSHRGWWLPQTVARGEHETTQGKLRRNQSALMVRWKCTKKTFSTFTIRRHPPPHSDIYNIHNTHLTVATMDNIFCLAHRPLCSFQMRYMCAATCVRVTAMMHSAACFKWQRPNTATTYNINNHICNMYKSSLLCYRWMDWTEHKNTQFMYERRTKSCGIVIANTASRSNIIYLNIRASCDAVVSCFEGSWSTCVWMCVADILLAWGFLCVTKIGSSVIRATCVSHFASVVSDHHRIFSSDISRQRASQ